MKNTDRRTLLLASAAGASLGLCRLWGWPLSSLAMGSLPEIRQGINSITGSVRINNLDVRIGAPVKPGDVVTTGPGGSATFVIGSSAFLARADTRIEFKAPAAAQSGNLAFDIVVNTGKMLAVFSRDPKQIVTPIAVIGIRGTGIYIESEPECTYACTCYGTADIIAKAAPGKKETVHTTHHEEPRYIYAAGTSRLITPAPVINHTDSELTLLESLVHRTPPFQNKQYNY